MSQMRPCVLLPCWPKPRRRWMCGASGGSSLTWTPEDMKWAWRTTTGRSPSREKAHRRETQARETCFCTAGRVCYDDQVSRKLSLAARQVMRMGYIATRVLSSGNRLQRRLETPDERASTSKGTATRQEFA